MCRERGLAVLASLARLELMLERVVPAGAPTHAPAKPQPAPEIVTLPAQVH